MALFSRLAESGRWDALHHRMRTRVHWPLDGAAIAADRRSFRAWLRARHWDAHAGGNGRETVIRARPLGGAPVLLRQDTVDAWALSSALLHPLHRPPRKLMPSDIRLVFDLGANIGLTMADFAHRNPEARVVGVEMAPDNARLCRRNVGPWANRCTVIQAAAWPREGQVAFDPGIDVLSSRIAQGANGHVNGTNGTSGHAQGANGHAQGATPEVPTVSIDALLAAHARPGQPIDLLKLDVEGAEAALLTEATDWARRVRVISVEVHAPYSVARCIEDLEAIGFDATLDPRFRGYPGEGMPPVVGVRRDPPGLNGRRGRGARADRPGRRRATAIG